MADYELRSETFEVPKNTGINGFLLALRTILELSRVQGVTIDARGKVTYQRFVPKGEFSEVGPTISFETLMPYACVRNGEVVEMASNEKNPTLTIARLFQAAARERIFPVAWVASPYTTLWDWFRKYAGIEMENREEFFGLPILLDRNIEDYVLILATANGRTTNIVDTHKSFKVIMPQRAPREEDAFNRGGSGEGGYSVPGDSGPVPAVGVRSGAQSGSPNGKAGAGGSGD